MRKTIQYKLKTNRSDQKFLLKLLDKGKSIYNLALSECRKRLNRIQSDCEYKELKARRKVLKLTKQPASEIDAKLKDIILNRYKLTNTDVEKFVKDGIGYLKEGVNSQFVQVLADRAVKATKRLLYGKAKKVRFKGKWDNILTSVHSKQTETGFVFDPDSIAIVYGTGKKKISIPLVLHYRKDHEYHNRYIEQIIDNYRNHNAIDIAYIRLVRRIIKGHNVFYVQFVIDVRPADMSDEQIKAENQRIIQYNSELIHKAVIEGKPINRLKLKHFVSNIVEYSKTNTVIKKIGSSPKELKKN